MATKTDFSMQLGQPNVVGVDPSSAAQVIKLRGAATADALKMLGTTAYEAFAGYQAEGFKQEQTGVIQDLQASMTSLKEGDIVNKARLEQGLSRVAPEQEAFRASAILAGADPEEARKNASIFAQEKEAPILTTYRAEQRRLAELRDQMPEKEKEAMLRSEVLLKNYITRYPGFANTFRSISQEVTGQKNLEMYSVQQLYKDIDFIEKQKEAGAKAAAQAQEQSQKAFVKDATTGGDMSETQALELYASLPPVQRLKIANGQVALVQERKAAEDSLKQGGIGLQNFVTNRLSVFHIRSVQASASVFTDLKKFGITEEQMIGGNIPPEKRYDPNVQAALEKATQVQLRLLDEEYLGAQTELQKMTSKPVDAASARQAQADLTSWYKGAKEDLIKNGVGQTLSMFSSKEDEKTTQARMALVKSFRETLDIDPDVAKQFANPALEGEARAKYPPWAAGLDHIEKMRRAAFRGVSTSEWKELQQEYGVISSKIPAVPKTISAVTASLIKYKDTGRKLEDASRGLGDKTVTEILPEFMNVSMASPANNKDALTLYPTAITEAIRKLPASEKEMVLAQIKGVSNSYIYSSIGHGYRAKDTYTELKDSLNTWVASLPSGKEYKYDIGFSDATGSQALSVNVVPGKGTEKTGPHLQRQFAGTFQAKASTENLNNLLQSVDNNIRLRAIATGESTVALRKEFMTTFMKEGKLSEVSTLVIPPDTTKPSATGVSLVQPKASIDAYLSKLSTAESGGDTTAQASTSSATGQFQFTGGTWASTVKQMGKDYTAEDRKDPAKSKEVAKFLTEQNAQVLRKALGEEPDDSELYTAHFLGADTAVKFLKAKAATSVDKIVSDAAIQANKTIFLDKDGKPRSKAAVQSILVKKMG